MANLVVVILPFLGFVVVVVSLWGRGFSWVDFGLLSGMYVVTGLGITVGFHRLFTHRSFEANRAVQFLLGVSGSMALEGPLLKWVALHRRHHQYSDTEQDPHSPHHAGHDVSSMFRGVWHAHMGWFFQPEPPNLSHYVKDLHQSRIAAYGERIVSRMGGLWSADPNGVGRSADRHVVGCGIRPDVGRAGADFFSPSRDLERELALSLVGCPAISDRRSKSEQLPLRCAGAWRGVA